MRPLLINTSNQGGAANACIRLHKALLEHGVESNLAVAINSASNDAFIQLTKDLPKNDLITKIKLKGLRIAREFGLFPYKFYSENIKERKDNLIPFTFPFSDYSIENSNAYQNSDIIHLHWTSYLLNWETFFKKNDKPIVWTLHDMNPFTGGCHHSLDCNRYTRDCHSCPQLIGAKNENYAFDLLKIKKKAIEKLENIYIVSPSQWLSERSKESNLFSKYPHFTIPNSVNTDVFKPYNKKFARDFLNLPQTSTLLLFIAANGEELKGGHYVSQVWSKLINKNSKLVVIGSQNIQGSDYYLNTIGDERLMALVYSAVDVLIVPSIVENLPNVIMESLCCGTPVIGFPVGGIPEMIDEGKNGYLCQEVSTDALRVVIEKFLKDPETFSEEFIRRKAVEKYNMQVQAQVYIELYKKINAK